MKNWLRAALIEFLGIDKLRDRVIDLDNELGEVEHFVKFPTDKIRAKRLAAGAVTAERLDTRVPVAIQTNGVYKTRNGAVVGPMYLDDGEAFRAPNYICDWDRYGQSAQGRDYDVVEFVRFEVGGRLKVGDCTTELTPPWKTAKGPATVTGTAQYRHALVASLERMAELSRKHRHVSDFNRGYADAYDRIINMVRGDD